MKNPDSISLKKINSVVAALTLLLFIIAVISIICKIEVRFHIAAIVMLGIFLILEWLSKPSDLNNSSSKIFLAAVLCGDLAYVLSLFFLLGRNFMS